MIACHTIHSCAHDVIGSDRRAASMCTKAQEVSTDRVIAGGLTPSRSSSALPHLHVCVAMSRPTPSQHRQDTLHAPRSGDEHQRGGYKRHVMETSGFTAAALNSRAALIGAAVLGIGLALATRGSGLKHDRS